MKTRILVLEKHSYGAEASASSRWRSIHCATRSIPWSRLRFGWPGMSPASSPARKLPRTPCCALTPRSEAAPPLPSADELRREEARLAADRLPKPTGLTLGMAGRITEAKGHHILLAALAKLHASTRAVFVGAPAPGNRQDAT
jgi:glycosyltransferase involved in cell wall biosynthesis